MKYTVILLLFIISGSAFGQNTNEIFDILAGYLKKMSYYKYDSPNPDSVSIENAKFKSVLLKYLKEYPSSLASGMDKVVDAGLKIATSDDRLFRIYSWDTETGGTMKFYENIYQYSTGKKVYVMQTVSDVEGDPNSWFSKIYTLAADAGTYYLGLQYADFSNRDKYTGLGFFMIEKDSLKDNIKLVKTARGLESAIGIGYDFFSLVDHPERPLDLIKYDAAEKTVKVPVVNQENGSITDKYETYKFTGKYFEIVK